VGWIFGAWPIIVVLMAVTAAVAGRMTSKSIWSIFIDSRNTASLTQFQLVVWTFTIVPVLVAVVIGRAVQDPATAWDVTVPAQVWGVLGISLGSTTLATAVKSQKNGSKGTPLGASDRVLTRTQPKNARFSDMLAYDEGTGALANLDVTKFQNFIFTVALAAVYLWSCGWLIGHAQTPSHLTALPGFSGVALGLLGISHAAYLTGKVIPQSGSPAVPGDTATELAAAKFKPASPAGEEPAALQAPLAPPDPGSPAPLGQVVMTLQLVQPGADNETGPDGET